MNMELIKTLKRLLMDHVTLRTGVMKLKIQMASQEKITF